MVKGPLVDRYIEAGRKLIELMPLAELRQPELVAWVQEDSDRWTLLLGSSEVDNLGLRAFLEVMLAKVFKTFGDRVWPIELSALRVVSPRDPLIKALTQRASNSNREVRVSGMVGEQYLEDALVYPAA